MTISAQDWIDRSSVDPAIGARWPDYRVLDGVRMGPSTLLRETAELPILLAP